MLKDAFELHRQGHLDEAEQGYRAWLLGQPDDVEALHLLGLLRHQRGDSMEAAQLVDRAHQLAPENPRLELSRASLLFRNGDHAGAGIGYVRALALDPNLVGAHIGLGQLALIDGDRTRAEQHFRIALRAGEDGHALAGLGALMLERGDTEAALRYLTRAADLVPDYAMIQFMLGQAFSRRDAPAFAEQAFGNALRLNPDLHAARHWLAEVLLKDGRPREAEAQYQALLSVPTFALAAEIGFADVARMENRLEDAVAHYRAALAMQPALSVPARALAWALAALGRNDEVIVAYDNYLAHAPDDNEVRVLRADVLTLLGRLTDAAADWHHLCERDAADMLPRIRLASIEERLRHLPAAVAHADVVLGIDAEQPDMLLIRTRAQLRDGDDAGARATLNQLGQVALDDAQGRLCWNYRGRLHDLAGELPGAAHSFTEAQRGLPSVLPPLDDPRPELVAALREPAGDAWPDAPVLLLGLPGSGVERIAALLADQPQLQVLRDRIGTALRDDDFNHPRHALYCGPLDEADIAALRERYVTALRMAGIGPGRTVVDWLPRWDAHLLALVRRAMPGTRLVIVERDPRDTLLNWLAFGWVHGCACPEPAAAAQWLARARRHLHFTADPEEPRRIVVAADPLLDDARESGAELARFLGLDALQPGAELAATLQGLGGLPVRFAPGHWHDYRETLADAFAHLDGA